MLVSGQLLLNDLPDRARTAPGYVRIEGDQIAEVVTGEAPAECDAGGPACLICPGFIDTHLHLPQFDMQGAHGLPLLEWLERSTFPDERKWADADYAAAMAERAMRRLFSHGTTGICAYSTVHADATRAALQAACQLGIRGVIGQSLMDRNAPDDLCRPADQLIDETTSLLDDFPPGGRVAAAVTPRFAISCTDELLAAAGRLAAERDATVQSHLAETIPECEWAADLFGGARYVDIYRDAGLLTERSIYGHCIYLSAEDRRTMADRGALAAHCPTANSFLRAGAMDRRATLSEGVTLTLGSDIGAGYEASMVRVGRAMIETASSIGESFPVAAEAWRQITAGNAAALGWQDAGHLRVGAPADLVLIEPSVPWLGANVDPLSMLMFAWDDRWLTHCWARGELAYCRG
ncbi:Guanine deaminase [Posidoniimonas polymericola]|uniref:Guanine deaminase n=1 Tax=Posidoniimonas polymericola TaxID=2528002 RepID=A0A5C5YQA2_9BACT|nr:amidohydrolase family protein [Posidoniimonas polymericola]TWT77111.1 Guanine deaminase [Posidoniimonas polymericola]